MIYWYRQLLGIALYRNGFFKEALDELEVAMDSDAHECATLASLAAALTAHALGDDELARRCLARGGEGWRIMIESGDGQLSPHWHEQANIEFLLQEVRETLGGGSRSRP